MVFVSSIGIPVSGSINSTTPFLAIMRRLRADRRLPDVDRRMDSQRTDPLPPEMVECRWSNGALRIQLRGETCWRLLIQPFDGAENVVI